MLEGKALVVAIMMLTAAPIVATDQGQAFLGDVTYEIGEVFDEDEEETKVIDKVLDEPNTEDKKLLLTDEMKEEDCLTIQQFKDLVEEREEVVDDRKDEGARGDSKDDKEKDEKKDSDVAKEEWTDKKKVAEDEACLSEEEWTLKFEAGDDKEEPCFTFEDLEEKMKGEKKHHKKGWDRIYFDEDKDWDREDNDWAEDEEFRLYLAELSEACGEGDEEACDELLEIREELAEDREEEERDDEDDGARSGEDESDEEEDDGEHNHADDEADDHSHDDDEADDHNHVTDRYDENWEEIRAVIQELAEACDDGNEEACVELREMITEMMDDRKENDWNDNWDRDEKDWDEDACLTMEEWKEVLGDDKEEKDERDRDDDRKEKSPHRDNFVREILEELEYACDEENDEEACAELEEMLAEFEEREGECDKERDDEEDESEQEESEDDETDEDESNEEDSEE